MSDTIKVCREIQEALARRLCVLIVDDCQEDAELLTEAVGPDRFEVVRVRTAEEALQMLRMSKVDMVLLDLQLEGPDGITVLEWLDRHGQHIPRAVVTGSSWGPLIDRAKKFGIINALLKPVTRDTIDRLFRSQKLL